MSGPTMTRHTNSRLGFTSLVIQEVFPWGKGGVEIYRFSGDKVSIDCFDNEGEFRMVVPWQRFLKLVASLQAADELPWSFPPTSDGD